MPTLSPGSTSSFSFSLTQKSKNGWYLYVLPSIPTTIFGFRTRFNTQAIAVIFGYLAHIRSTLRAKAYHVLFFNMYFVNSSFALNKSKYFLRDYEPEKNQESRKNYESRSNHRKIIVTRYKNDQICKLNQNRWSR